MWTTLNFESRSKTKKLAKDICNGTLIIECERDWPVALGATLGDEEKIKTIFLVLGIVLGKAGSVNQNRWNHFWENLFFYIFYYVYYP